jgi:hypothetical protein
MGIVGSGWRTLMGHTLLFGRSPALQTITT